MWLGIIALILVAVYHYLYTHTVVDITLMGCTDAWSV